MRSLLKRKASGDVLPCRRPLQTDGDLISAHEFTQVMAKLDAAISAAERGGHKAGQEAMRDRAAGVFTPTVEESTKLQEFYSKPGASKSRQMAARFKSKANTLLGYAQSIRALPIEAPQS